MSQVIPIDICKLRDINEGEVENSVKIIERRKTKIQLQANILTTEVDSLNCENVVLDKQTNCMESLSQKLKVEISELKTKAENAACCLESTKWQFYKANLLKEFENEINKDVEKQKFKHNQFVNQTTHIDNFYDAPVKNKDNNLKSLREKAEKLKQEIEKKKKAKEIEKVDNLHRDIQILERRNSALTVRYQRQVQETESRYRQALTELNSLQKLLIEKNTVFTSI